MEKEKHNSAWAALIENILEVFLILLLLEVCGCHVFRGIGNLMGECVNAYRQASGEAGIRPSDLR